MHKNKILQVANVHLEGVNENVLGKKIQMKNQLLDHARGKEKNLQGRNVFAKEIPLKKSNGGKSGKKTEKLGDDSFKKLLQEYDLMMRPDEDI